MSTEPAARNATFGGLPTASETTGVVSTRGNEKRRGGALAGSASGGNELAARGADGETEGTVALALARAAAAGSGRGAAERGEALEQASAMKSTSEQGRR